MRFRATWRMSNFEAAFFIAVVTVLVLATLLLA
jgi:hypothetical protein